jgi:hypothetical protein
MNHSMWICHGMNEGMMVGGSDGGGGFAQLKGHTIGYLCLAQPLVRAFSSSSNYHTARSSSSYAQIPDVTDLIDCLEDISLVQDDATIALEVGNNEKELFSAWHISIVYSETWQVPVLYFNVFETTETTPSISISGGGGGSSSHQSRVVSGSPLCWQEIEKYMEEGLKKHDSSQPGSVAGSVWPVVSHELHPVTGEPCYMLHPCHTAARMSLLLTAAETTCCSDIISEGDSSWLNHYLSAWLNLVGGAVGLHLSPYLYAEIQRSCGQK